MAPGVLLALLAAAWLIIEPPGIYQLAVRVHDFAAASALGASGRPDGPARLGEIVIE
jgi:hypothetical protein